MIFLLLVCFGLCHFSGLPGLERELGHTTWTELSDDVCAQYDSDCTACTTTISHAMDQEGCGWVGDRDWTGSRCLHGDVDGPFLHERPLIWEFLDGIWFGTKCCSGLTACASSDSKEQGTNDYCMAHSWCSWCTKGYDTLNPTENMKPGLCFYNANVSDLKRDVASYNCTSPIDVDNCCGAHYSTCQECYSDDSGGVCSWCGDFDVCTESSRNKCAIILVNCCESFTTCESCQSETNISSPSCTWCASQNACVDFADAVGVSSSQNMYYTGVYADSNSGGTCDKVVTGDSSYCSGCALAISKQACISAPDCVWIADPVQTSTSSGIDPHLTPFCTEGNLWGAKSRSIYDRHTIRYSYSTYYWGVGSLTGVELCVLVFVSAVIAVIVIITVTCSMGMHRRRRLRQLAECEDEDDASSSGEGDDVDGRGVRAMKFNKVEWESSD